MAVDKNLFLYDLAVVAIMKNESHYVQEWLDYHILAGVDHFFIYDNGSTDNFKKVLQPYIDAGIVDYFFYPPNGQHHRKRQISFYNEAIQRYKFFCRYIAFIDADEFIFPQENKSIVEIVDEILSDSPNFGGLAINWQCFGSNFQEKADYSKGVLERFTRRAPVDWGLVLEEPYFLNVGNFHVKSIVNPRTVDIFYNPHFAVYFENYFAVNEQGEVVEGPFSQPVSAEKIVINHYYTKSKEEALARGREDYIYDVYDKNEVFDDTILEYRSARLQIFGGIKPINYEKITAALVQNLAPTLNQNVPAEFFEGKLKTFLTCRALSSHLKKFLPNKESARILEETALNAIQKTLYTEISMTEMQLLLAELPKILPLDYPVTKEIHKNCLKVIAQMKDIWWLQLESMDKFEVCKNWAELNYIFEMLKLFC